MVKERVLDGFSPPKEEEQMDLKADEILEVIKEFRCSYPSEICGETDISKETVYRKLRFMVKKGIIKRMPLARKERVPEWLKPRIPDLWARGISGNAIKRLSWYMMVDDEKSKFKAEEKPEVAVPELPKELEDKIGDIKQAEVLKPGVGKKKE